MRLWWAVVIVIFHAVKVKLYWRNDICWRDIYKISLRSSLFPIGSPTEILIPIGPFSRRLCSQRAASVVVNRLFQIDYLAYLVQQNALPVHRKLEWRWEHGSQRCFQRLSNRLGEWYTVIWQSFPINIISPCVFME